MTGTPKTPKITSKDTATLIIDKFNGRITRFRDGDINSGMCVQSSLSTAWGYDCLQQSGNLIFNQTPVSIAGSVITDLVVAGKIRIESGVSYMYAIGHNRMLYKIQINDPSSHNPDKDTPVLLATLSNAQTFLYGASITFYTVGGTEYIWIGHDSGVTRINFDGTSETVIGSADSTHWLANNPRQVVSFIGSLFYTNGSNLAQIDTTGLVKTYTVLSPGFPTNNQARDIRLTPDGRYIVTVVNRTPIGDQTSVAVDTSVISGTESMLVYWNGTDVAASSVINFPDFPITSYYTWAGNEYVFGEQIGGAMLGTPSKVINVLEFESAPIPNAVGSSGDFLGWGATRFVNGHTQGVFNLYGTIDNETPIGFYKQLLLPSTLSGGDVIRIPFISTVSSWQPSGANSGYTNQPFQLFGTGKSYFSTVEYNGSTTKYGFYAFKNVLDFTSSANTGMYQTQNEFFQRKIKPITVRVYFEPPSVPSLCSFTLDMIGITGQPLTGGNFTFSSSNQIIAGEDTCQYTPQVAATSYLGVRITNVGYLSPIIHRVEVDYEQFGN